MTMTLNRSTEAEPASDTRAALVCGTIGGGAVVGCCSVGLLGAVFSGLGVRPAVVRTAPNAWNVGR